MRHVIVERSLAWRASLWVSLGGKLANIIMVMHFFVEINIQTVRTVELVHIGRASAYPNTFRYELSLLKRKFVKKSFSHAGPRAWNDLSSGLQELTDTQKAIQN